MIGVSLEIAHDNCVLTSTSKTHGITFTTAYWQCDRTTGRWEKRMHATAPTSARLDEGLRILERDEGTLEFELLSRWDGMASFYAVFDGAEATDIVLEHGGFTIGPSRQANGRELWHLGFDGSMNADAAVDALVDDCALTVIETREIDADTYNKIAQHYETAASFLASCEELTPTEHETLKLAVQRGFFETPRNETLASLGEELGVSDVAVSKTLRRAERKLLGPATAALEELD